MRGLSVLLAAALAGMVAASDESEARHFVRDYQGVLWGVVILLGLVHCFAGYKVLKVTAFTSGFVIGGGGAFYAAKAIFTHASFVEYAAFGALLVVGVMAGIGVLILLDVGIFLIGAVLGVCLAFLLNTALLYRIAPHHDNAILYAAMAVLALVCGAVAVKRRRAIVILATAVAGAYGTAYGIGHFAGKFPNPFHMRDQLGGRLPTEWWAYFAGVVVFSVAGAVTQFMTTKAGDEDEEEHRADDRPLMDGKADAERGEGRYGHLYEEHSAPRRGTGRPLQYVGRRYADTTSWGGGGSRSNRPVFTQA